MSKQTLTQQIKSAIAKKDIQRLYELKDICDHIHQTGESYKGYKPKDLPKDNLYEEMVQVINSHATDTTEMIVAEQTAEPVKHRHQKMISDLWMGSITKETEILDIPKAILLPKFDGCSCGIKLKRYSPNAELELFTATTRGTTEGYDLKQTDITEKFAMLGTSLIKTLSSMNASKIKLQDGHTLGQALQITIRGEIVLKDRKFTDSAPASVVAGKINGGIDVFTKSIPLIEFIPYEFMRLTYSNTDIYSYYVPTQLETIDILNQLKLIHFPHTIVDLNKDSLPLVQEHFTMLNQTIPQPMDGVVYCSSSWRYPTLNEQTKPKQYGKYAWKPSSEATSTLKSISYSLARDGKFTFILSYEPVRINGKKYMNAKTATSRMVLLKGIGIGSVITVRLAGDISPMVEDFVNDDSVEPYTLPTKCPFCDTKTLLRKGKTPVLSCTNPMCPEVVKQKMLNFLKTLQIKGVAEAKLNKLDEITLEEVDNNYFPEGFLHDKLLHTDTRSFLVAVGIGGPQAVDKLIKCNTNMNPQETIKKNYEQVYDLIAEDMDEDPFIAEVMDYTAVVLL